MDLRPKKLDIYIMKKFLSTFLVAILLIIIIVIVFDVSENVDDFVAKKAPLKAIVVDYYLNLIPFYMNMFSALFVFITVIFFTSRMAANSEIVAILSCGVSFPRMMVPYLVTAAIIVAGAISMNLWVVPKANESRHEFEALYKKRRTQAAERNIHYQIAPGQFVYIESFSKWNNTAQRFTLETIENNEIVSKISAETAVWDTTFNGWRLRKYFIREYDPGTLSDKTRTGQQLDTIIPLTVDDFYRNKKTVEDLQYADLQALINTQNLRGDSDVMYSEIEKYTRWALPFSALILTIMGVSLSSKKKRGGMGWNLAVGIALSFSYILFLRFSQMFVFTGSMSPALALWLPNMIYAVITAVLYHFAPK